MMQKLVTDLSELMENKEVYDLLDTFVCYGSEKMKGKAKCSKDYPREHYPYKRTVLKPRKML